MLCLKTLYPCIVDTQLTSTCRKTENKLAITDCMAAFQLDDEMRMLPRDFFFRISRDYASFQQASETPNHSRIITCSSIITQRNYK